MTIELNTTIAQAEVLFLSFAQLVADVDRRKAEVLITPKASTLRRRGTVDGDPEHTNLSMSRLSNNLKELLNRRP